MASQPPVELVRPPDQFQNDKNSDVHQSLEQLQTKSSLSSQKFQEIKAICGGPFSEEKWELVQKIISDKDCEVSEMNFNKSNVDIVHADLSKVVATKQQNQSQNRSICEEYGGVLNVGDHRARNSAQTTSVADAHNEFNSENSDAEATMTLKSQNGTPTISNANLQIVVLQHDNADGVMRKSPSQVNSHKKKLVCEDILAGNVVDQGMSRLKTKDTTDVVNVIDFEEENSDSSSSDGMRKNSREFSSGGSKNSMSTGDQSGGSGKNTNGLSTDKAVSKEIEFQNHTIQQSSGTEKRNKLKGVGDCQKQAPYVPNNKPLIISNNFAKVDSVNSKSIDPTDKPKENDDNHKAGSHEVGLTPTVPAVHVDKAKDKEENSNSGNKKQPQSNAWNTKIPDPAAPVVTHNLATKLRAQEAMKITTISISPPKITSRQGRPAIVFNLTDFKEKLAVRCRFTLIGMFTNMMPKMEIIRKQFVAQTELRGGVKLSHFNSKHLYIDLDNEYDQVTVWSKGRMHIEGQILRLQKWTPTFKPEEETPLVPILP
ncbi:hypothetical protein FXO38_05303 [Capsicum annuum]|nr:hypothetical protein FXO38_05303 [Capsicum annuum]